MGCPPPEKNNISAGLFAGAGVALSRWGDVSARRTGLSGSWIGLALLASVTSQPELTVDMPRVTVADAPNVALGNALGSCVQNLLFLVRMDSLSRQQTLWSRSGPGHWLAAAFSVALLGLTPCGLPVSQFGGALGPASTLAARWGFDPASPLILGLCLLAMRTLWLRERSQPRVLNDPSPRPEPALPSLQRAVWRFAMAVAVVVAAGVWLPFLAVTLSALRLGAVDMAIGNFLGSNLFNVTLIAVDDFYRPGSLLADVSPVHAITAATALTINGLAMVGWVLQPRTRVLGIAAWVSLGLSGLYLLNTCALFLYGEKRIP